MNYLKSVSWYCFKFSQRSSTACFIVGYNFTDSAGCMVICHFKPAYPVATATKMAARKWAKALCIHKESGNRELHRSCALHFRCGHKGLLKLSLFNKASVWKVWGKLTISRVSKIITLRQEHWPQASAIFIRPSVVHNEWPEYVNTKNV